MTSSFVASSSACLRGCITNTARLDALTFQLLQIFISRILTNVSSCSFPSFERRWEPAWVHACVSVHACTPLPAKRHFGKLFLPVSSSQNASLSPQRLNKDDHHSALRCKYIKKNPSTQNSSQYRKQFPAYSHFCLELICWFKVFYIKIIPLQHKKNTVTGVASKGKQLLLHRSKRYKWNKTRWLIFTAF